MMKYKEKLGEGWVYYPIRGVYEFNNGEFCVAEDIVKQRCLSLGRPYVKSVHLIPNLNWFYRESFGYDNSTDILERDIQSRDTK